LTISNVVAEISSEEEFTSLVLAAKDVALFETFFEDSSPACMIFSN